MQKSSPAKHEYTKWAMGFFQKIKTIPKQNSRRVITNKYGPHPVKSDLVTPNSRSKCTSVDGEPDDDHSSDTCCCKDDTGLGVRTNNAHQDGEQQGEHNQDGEAVLPDHINAAANNAGHGHEEDGDNNNHGSVDEDVLEGLRVHSPDTDGNSHQKLQRKKCVYFLNEPVP